MTGAELNPSDHQDHDVRKVLKKLVKEGWTLRKEGHWGRLYCPCDDGGCTTIPVGGSPQNPGNAAKKIARLANRCPLEPEDPRRSLAGGPRRSLPAKTDESPAEADEISAGTGEAE